MVGCSIRIFDFVQDTISEYVLGHKGARGFAEGILDAECGFFGAKPYFHTASFPEKARSKKERSTRKECSFLRSAPKAPRGFAEGILDAERGFFGAKPYLHTASFTEKARYAPKAPRRISL